MSTNAIVIAMLEDKVAETRGQLSARGVATNDDLLINCSELIGLMYELSINQAHAVNRVEQALLEIVRSKT